MSLIKPRHTPEEFKERGDRIFEERIYPDLTPEDHGKFVAIDIEGRGYEIAEDSLSARERLRERLPDAQIWLRRVGYDAAIQVGWHRRPEAR